jgi:hypothetical protein
MEEERNSSYYSWPILLFQSDVSDRKIVVKSIDDWFYFLTPKQQRLVIHNNLCRINII